MKAFDVMATLNDQKQLLLDENLDIDTPSRVRVILWEHPILETICLEYQ